MPPELLQELAALKRRAAVETLQTIALKLCSHKDLSLGELAVALRRNTTYLQHRVVAPLIRAGELAFTIPSKPHDPRQTYRTVSRPGSSER
jgi:hypothetical protein